MVVLQKHCCIKAKQPKHLSARVLGDSLGALRHGVLGEFAGGTSGRQSGSAGRERGLGVVLAKAAGLRGVRSKTSLMNEFMMLIDFLEIPVSGCTCLRTR